MATVESSESNTGSEKGDDVSVEEWIVNKAIANPVNEINNLKETLETKKINCIAISNATGVAELLERMGIGQNLRCERR